MTTKEYRIIENKSLIIKSNLRWFGQLCIAIKVQRKTWFVIVKRATQMLTFSIKLEWQKQIFYVLCIVTSNNVIWNNLMNGV